MKKVLEVLSKQLSLYSVIVSSIITNTAKADDCKRYPKEAPVIEACLEEDDLTISGDNFNHKFHYPHYTQQLSHLITNWIDKSNLDKDNFCGLEADILLSIPELNPQGYALRITIDHPRGPLMFNLPGSPRDWTLQNLIPIVFEEGTSYPESYGYVAGTLIAKSSTDATEPELVKYLSEFQVQAEKIRKSWYKISVPVFEEIYLQEKIETNARFHKYLSSITMNSSYEWISHKGAIANFDIECSQNQIKTNL